MRLFTRNRGCDSDALRLLWLFNQCSDRELDLVRSLTTEVEVRPGHVLARRGDVALQLLVMRSGRATVVSRGLPERTLGPGSWFGEVSMLDRGPQTVDVVVEERSRVLVAQPRELARLLRDAPSVARKLLVDLAIRVRVAERELAGREHPAAVRSPRVSVATAALR